jgi:hypothetical protein
MKGKNILHIFLIIIFILLIFIYFSIYKIKTGISIIIKNNENDKIKDWLNKLNIVNIIDIHETYDTRRQHLYNISLKKKYFDILMPDYNTFGIIKNINKLNIVFNNDLLDMEIILSLLGCPVHFVYESLGELLSEISIRRNISYYASKTHVLLNTRTDITIKRPEEYFKNNDTDILLLDNKSLIDGIIYSLLPSISRNIYEFSCKRACEYIVLVSILLELKKHNKEHVIKKIESIYRTQPIKSVSFNDIFMIEYGCDTFPLPKLFYIPGDKIWFKNMDNKSSYIRGFEGKWSIYLGNGFFGDFWKTCGDVNNQFTFEDILIEIYNWRFCVKYNENKELYIDENEVNYRNKLCKKNEEEKNKIVSMMSKYRNKYFLDGGAVDRTRERPRYIKDLEKIFI